MIAATGEDERSVFFESTVKDFTVNGVTNRLVPADAVYAAEQRRKNVKAERIPVIIMSGFTKELDTKTHVFEPMMYQEWPAAKFIEKPAKLADLAAAIAELLAADEAPAGGKA
jgi:CheY-like chemotaxis protein